jgi:hypothetical protein
MPMRNSEWFHRRAEMINRPYKIPLPKITWDKQARGIARSAAERRIAALADAIEARLKAKRRIPRREAVRRFDRGKCSPREWG